VVAGKPITRSRLLPQGDPAASYNYDATCALLVFLTEWPTTMCRRNMSLMIIAYTVVEGRTVLVEPCTH
jgi:hypothetical protein